MTALVLRKQLHGAQPPVQAPQEEPVRLPGSASRMGSYAAGFGLVSVAVHRKEAAAAVACERCLS